MNRRAFLLGLGATTAIGAMDWLRYFRKHGVPAGARDLGIAQAVAQTAGEPRFLVYWFQEGGWDGYSMFNPVATRNDALGSSAPAAQQIYRPAGINLVDGLYPIAQQGNIRYGHLAAAGTSLFPEMAVVSSHRGGTFHSGSRLEYHYGKYDMQYSSRRAADERTVMQAFCEKYGAAYLLPHISWHRWLSDGELSPANYPEGTGYYEKLGPAFAHTIYGSTPKVMRERIAQIAASAGAGREAAIHKFVDNLHANFMKDKNSDAVKAFAAAVEAHKTLVSGGANLDPNQLFADQALRSELGIQTQDEETSATSVNGNPARSKESPNTNVQALMAYELMTKNVSCAFWIESREIRGFDTHNSRSAVVNRKGQVDQKSDMDQNLWNPLKTLVARLKNTQYGVTGKSYYDMTTIVLASEMGRSVSGGDEDVCQHWNTSSVAFLGGTVKGNTQFGRVGTATLESIPIMPDGSLDPAFDPDTGNVKSGASQSAQSFVPDAGHVYATALELSGISKANQTGKNSRPPLSFVKK